MGLHLLFANPSSQSGKAARSIERALEGLRARGLEARLVETEPDGRTVELVRRRVEEERPEVVICLGGDGTFNEVARGLLASGHPAPLGLFPMGTANDQGRSLGVAPGPEAIAANVDVIVAGHVVHLDAGRCEVLDAEGRAIEERLFFDAVGWGMQPEILAQRNRDRARVAPIPLARSLAQGRAGFISASLRRVARSVVEPTKFSAEVISEGRTHRWDGLLDLMISGTPVYAGEWVADRFAEVDDGAFELVPMQGHRDWASKALRDLRTLPLFQEDLDSVGLRHVPGFSASDFLVTLSRPERPGIASQIDGEEWVRADRFRVTVLPRLLPVLAPAGFEPPWRFARRRPAPAQADG